MDKDSPATEASRSVLERINCNVGTETLKLETEMLKLGILTDGIDKFGKPSPVAWEAEDNVDDT